MLDERQSQHLSTKIQKVILSIKESQMIYVRLVFCSNYPLWDIGKDIKGRITRKNFYHYGYLSAERVLVSCSRTSRFGANSHKYRKIIFTYLSCYSAWEFVTGNLLNFENYEQSVVKKSAPNYCNIPLQKVVSWPHLAPFLYPRVSVALKIG